MSENKIISIINIMSKDGNLNELFKFNAMTKDIEYTRKTAWGEEGVLTDGSFIHLKYYMAYTHNKEWNRQNIEEAVFILASRNSYNPLNDYLKGLKWDGVDRLSVWLIEICGVDDNSYTRDVSRKILCAAVKRAMNPGCKFDSMLILEGGQGIGKSTMVDVLGGQWYLDTSLSSSENKKDVVDQMRTSWFIEISDLAGFKKQEIEHLKHFLSDASDRVRMPYAKRSQDFPRQCVFIGTHNPSGDNEYFRDDTGNRRFWPIECKTVNVPKLREWRDQLFAEAMIKYKDESLYLDNKESCLIFDQMQKNRQIETPLNGMIEQYLMTRDMVSNKEIIENVFTLNIGRLTFMELRSKCTVIGIYMRKINWVKGENKKRGWYFRPGFEHLEVTEAQVQQEVGWQE